MDLARRPEARAPRRARDALIGGALAAIGMVLVAIGGLVAVGHDDIGLIVAAIGLALTTLGISFQKRAKSGA